MAHYPPNARLRHPPPSPDSIPSSMSLPSSSPPHPTISHAFNNPSSPVSPLFSPHAALAGPACTISPSPHSLTPVRALPQTSLSFYSSSLSPPPPPSGGGICQPSSVYQGARVGWTGSSQGGVDGEMRGESNTRGGVMNGPFSTRQGGGKRDEGVSEDGIGKMKMAVGNFVLDGIFGQEKQGGGGVGQGIVREVLMEKIMDGGDKKRADEGNINQSGIYSSMNGYIAVLQSWFPNGMRRLRRYFAVSHRFVIYKLFFLLCPIATIALEHLRGDSSMEHRRKAHRGAHGRRSEDGGKMSSDNMTTNTVINPPPHHQVGGDDKNKDDGDDSIEELDYYYESDLYIPLMGFVTYILVVCLCRGAVDDFGPGLFGASATYSFTQLLLEVAITKLGFYLCGGGAGLGFFDILGLCGYKYVTVTYAGLIGFGLNCLHWQGFDIPIDGRGGDVRGDGEEVATTESLGGGNVGGGNGERMKGLMGDGQWWGWLSGSGSATAVVVGASSVEWMRMCYWVMFLYFGVSLCIAMFLALQWYNPGQTETASSWEVQVRTSAALKYFVIAVAIGQLPMSWLLLPRFS
eukprot:GHVQ01040174.1.p1 GENE.GHVQ01040174.1~~GHVQ01040174.1.p1  ORF type:complete len:574 (+),score=137.02 GHVQ01040174.1:209-1930(+)